MMIIDDDDALCEYDRIGIIVMMSVYALMIFLIINIKKMHDRQVWIYEP